MKPVVPKSRPLLDAGGVSATDIIMNLFVFFFIAFSLLASFESRKEASADEDKDERQHQILLPTSARDAPAVSREAITVELDLAEQVRVDGKGIARDQLTAAVRDQLRHGSRPVVLRAHRELSLGATVTLMDRIWAAGPESVAIATLPGGTDPAP